MKIFIRIVIVILAISFIAVSCNFNKVPEKKFPYYVVITNGSGYDFNQSVVYCDSVSMISKTEAISWVNGSKMKIFADGIFIFSNIKK